MHYYRYTSPIGVLTAASDGDRIIGLWLEGQQYFGRNFDCSTAQLTVDPPLKAVFGWLDDYFSGMNPSANTLPLAPRGSPYQLSVWKRLLEIPYGETVTYGSLASEIAKQNGLKRMSAQAVGGAVSHNPISIIIPCHRVLGANGSLTGYAGGVEKKQWLLCHEGVKLLR